MCCPGRVQDVSGTSSLFIIYHHMENLVFHLVSGAKNQILKLTLFSDNLLAIDTKEPITSTILQVYDTLEEAKPKLEGLIKVKQETKRRRKDYICPTCKVDQGSDAAFNAHLKIHPLECLTCGKCFFRRANLALHMKMHLGIRNFK